MRKFNLLILLTTAFVLVFTSCKKDEDDEKSPNDIPKPTIAANQQQFTAPQELAQSTDPYAQQAYSYIMQVNAMTSFMSYFTPPATAEEVNTKSDSQTWTWMQSYTDQDGNVIEYTFTYTFTETSDKYIWDIDMGINGNTNDFIDAEEMKTGESGEMNIYYNALGVEDFDVYYHYNWTVSGGTTIVNMELHDGNSELYSYVLTVNQDGSGEIAYNVDEIIVFRLIWNANGSGTWFEYDEDGEITDQGSW